MELHILHYTLCFILFGLYIRPWQTNWRWHIKMAQSMLQVLVLLLILMVF